MKVLQSDEHKFSLNNNNNNNKKSSNNWVIYFSLQLPAKKATWEINSSVFLAKRLTPHFYCLPTKPIYEK